MTTHPHIRFLLPLLLIGCKSAPPPMIHHMQLPDSSITYPARPTTPPAPFKIFHHADSTFTLTVVEKSTDDEISALVWQLRDAARTHTFDKIKIPQKEVDADGSNVWFHIYRGAKCAPEKYAPKPPCGASYHAAGDYTFAPKTTPPWDSGQLNPGNDHPTNLWNPDAPYTPAN